MAGFLQRINNTYNQGGVSELLREISSLGVKGKSEILRNSQSIGYNQKSSVFDYAYGDLEEYDYLNIITGANSKYVPFQDRGYVDRRAEFRQVATEGEIENILTIITDETIVYDDNNYFCGPTALTDDNLKKKEELQKKLENNFKKIYNLFNFNDTTTAWWLFYKFLIDGFLAFEIIYNDPKNPSSIIGFKEIDPVTLENTIDSNKNPVWVQFRGDAQRQRILDDSQIIYISYSSSLVDGKVSYIERLIKPYNILSIMEQTRSTWAVVNSSFRMKFVIPVGGKSKNVARQTLKSLMNRYNEEITFDNSSGKYHINGRPHLPGVKQIWLPEKDGVSPTIESIGGDGPDLSNMEPLTYFRKKLELLSKVPSSRFNQDDDGGDTIDNSSSQITQEEARFNRFIIRLRSIFKELLTKPLWIQMVLDNQELKKDHKFKNAVNIDFFKYNLFEEWKEMEIENKKIEHIETMSRLMEADGTTPYFDMEFLIKKYKLLTPEDIRENEKMKKKNKPVEEPITTDTGGENNLDNTNGENKPTDEQPNLGDNLTL